jgi:hypothetical protein
VSNNPEEGRFGRSQMTTKKSHNQQEAKTSLNPQIERQQTMGRTGRKNNS